MNLSMHFTLEELTRSDTAVRLGIDNTPNHDELASLTHTAAGLERVRDVLGYSMAISSGFRCPKLNTSRHGSKTSQHMKGEAADFTSPDFGTPLQVCRAIVEHKDYIDFDQLIFEGNWTHVSFSDSPRGEVLTAHFDHGSVSYTRGLP